MRVVAIMLAVLASIIRADLEDAIYDMLLDLEQEISGAKCPFASTGCGQDKNDWELGILPNSYCKEKGQCCSKYGGCDASICGTEIHLPLYDYKGCVNRCSGILYGATVSGEKHATGYAYGENILFLGFESPYSKMVEYTKYGEFVNAKYVQEIIDPADLSAKYTSGILTAGYNIKDFNCPGLMKGISEHSRSSRSAHRSRSAPKEKIPLLLKLLTAIDNEGEKFQDLLYGTDMDELKDRLFN